MGGGLQVPLGLQLMVGICSLSVLRDLHETLFVPFLMYDRSRIGAVKMENLRGLLGIRRMDSPECTNY